MLIFKDCEHEHKGRQTLGSFMIEIHNITYGKSFQTKKESKKLYFNLMKLLLI